MTRTYENSDGCIGFEQGDAWVRIDSRTITRKMKRVRVFQLDSACAPELSVGNMKKLRDWIDAMLVEVKEDGDGAL